MFSFIVSKPRKYFNRFVFNNNFCINMNNFCKNNNCTKYWFFRMFKNVTIVVLVCSRKLNYFLDSFIFVFLVLWNEYIFWFIFLLKDLLLKEKNLVGHVILEEFCNKYVPVPWQILHVCTLFWNDNSFLPPLKFSAYYLLLTN